jgi:hypothetical protein
MTLQLSEIDYPPCWPDAFTLRVTASGCILTDEVPGDFQVWLDEPRLLEVVESWMTGAPDDFMGVWLHADLAEAVDDFIAMCPERGDLLDWARHLEIMAARLREAADG